MAENSKVLATNRKARFNYEITESIECGIVLQGTEVKSIKFGNFSFSDSYGRIMDNELWLVGLHITPYVFGTHQNHEHERRRKLLVHAMELKKLKKKTEEKGFTLIPLKFILKKGLVKVDIGIGRGKRNYDKRETIRARDLARDAGRNLRDH
jgi:SsrA-binding protein